MCANSRTQQDDNDNDDDNNNNSNCGAIPTVMAKQRWLYTHLVSFFPCASIPCSFVLQSANTHNTLRTHQAYPHILLSLLLILHAFHHSLCFRSELYTSRTYVNVKNVNVCITFITRRFACVRLFIYCLICVWEAFFSRLSVKRFSVRHVGVFCERVFVPAYRISSIKLYIYTTHCRCAQNTT